MPGQRCNTTAASTLTRIAKRFDSQAVLGQSDAMHQHLFTVRASLFGVRAGVSAVRLRLGTPDNGVIDGSFNHS